MQQRDKGWYNTAVSNPDYAFESPMNFSQNIKSQSLPFKILIYWD